MYIVPLVKTLKQRFSSAFNKVLHSIFVEFIALFYVENRK